LLFVLEAGLARGCARNQLAKWKAAEQAAPRKVQRAGLMEKGVGDKGDDHMTTNIVLLGERG
jgi:hypothetical protein